MRLTKLKVAGFKSFCDPTIVELPGQLVGVVGPNGCGKSNVMDAVRWVLGETRASELRGESMQDVIFNGSSNRKPVSRASVELVFDNSLGRAAGQWSQYAELAVKRVLTRNGQSDYFINNLKVRRKDITDLFLGTGLGPRAYAIIGQGMISRIIEAKPEEMRVFLEEAAGVTKYKERRKETEGRIEDTRENLTRVDDIRQELGGQMEKLEAQAEVARRYHDINSELTTKQQLLWFIRRNEARQEQQRLAVEVERAAVDLEAQTATLRELETRLETARETHYTASDGVHQAQSGLYSANAEVTRLEAEIRHQGQSRQQLEARLAQLSGEFAHWKSQAEKYEEDGLRWQELSDLADMRVEQAAMKLEMQQERLPQAEELQGIAQDEVNRERGRIAQVEQKIQVEQAHRGNAQRALQGFVQRRERLAQERDSLADPDTVELEDKQEELAMLREELAMRQETVADLQQRLPELDSQRRHVQAEVQNALRDVAAVQARVGALETLQKRVQGNSKLIEWLRRHGLEGRTPLWKRLHVEAGWEDAVEAVLRERLNALTLSLEVGEGGRLPAWTADGTPGGKLTLLIPDAVPATVPADSLAAKVRCEDGALAPIVADWLAAITTADTLEAALQRRPQLAPGITVVVPQGHLVTRGSVTLFAPDNAEHGLLERQREIEELSAALEVKQGEVETAQASLAEVEARLAQAQGELANARREAQDLVSREHALQVETLKLAQAVERARERAQQIEDQLAELALEEEEERAREMASEEAMAAAREELGELHMRLMAARGRLEEAERRLRDEREAVTQVERELRESQFSQRECASKLQEIASGKQVAARQVTRLAEEETTCRTQLAETRIEDLEPELQVALENRMEAEQRLSDARQHLEEATAGLREMEESRLRIEQSLNPLRERIGELKLKEQAAGLNAEQLAEQLVEAQADEAAIAEYHAKLVTEGGMVKVASLQSSIGHLQKAMLDLGAVNLAALEELDAARERKGFLDAQAEDLNLAMETLENAIRRIDKETRELLQHTFDTVNRRFGELFPTLFGGGRAELLMTGEEILDAGVQVIAQPPGKKNSTIHLLSGGEKALTAIALVFSFFQLNPAPFCLLDEVDAPLDDTNTERFAQMVKRMSAQTQFLFISHNKIAMEMAEQLVGVTMQESGVSRIVEVDMEEALKMREQVTA